MSLHPAVSAFPITPADPAGRVDTRGLERLLRRLLAADVDSIGLLGSTGTYAYLSRAERRRALEAAVACVNGRVPLLVGVGALRTDEAVRLAADARAIGATAGLLAPMSYTPLTDDEVFAHFATVARDSGLPLCIYDNPGTTHFTIGPALVERLARVPGVTAIKCPAPSADEVAAHVATLRALVPSGFSVGYSVDAHAVDALLAGGAVWYSVVAGLFPAPCVAIVRAIRAGDAATARRLNADLQPLWDLFRRFSSLRVVLTAATRLGLCDAAPPRPILPLDDAAWAEVEATLKRLHLL